MKPVKPIHIPTLLGLLLDGAKDRPIRISTVELAKKIGRSQQAASKHLLELEKDGYIERIRLGKLNSYRLTGKGLDALMSIHLALKSGLEAAEKIFEFKGYVFSGLREGAYYASLKGYRRQFFKGMGFDPYPGTLNLKLASNVERELKRELKLHPGVRIEGFEDEHRTFGGAKCFPALINDSVSGAVLVLERTYYDDSVLEVVAPTYLREKLNLKDGDLVTVKVYPTSTFPKSFS